MLDETGIVHALGKTSVQDNIDTNNSTSTSHQPSDRSIVPSSSPVVRIDDVMDGDYSEFDEELATLTEGTSALTNPVKGKRSRPSSRRGKTQTTVHSTAVKKRRHSKHKLNSAKKFKTTSSSTGYATLCATRKNELEEYKIR